MNIYFLNKRIVNYISHAKWFPKSQDAAPMGFVILGILKRSIQKRKIYIMSSLTKGTQRRIEQTGAVMHKMEFRKLDKKG
jgi:hypothetical protein